MANRSIFQLAIAGALISAVALAGFTSAPRPAHAQDDATTRTITVVGTGTAAGVPDVATVSLGVEVADENAAAALNEANRLIGEVTKAVIAAGVDQKNIRTTGVNIYSQPAPTPAGDASSSTGAGGAKRIYQASIGITITVEDKGTAGQALKVGEVINAAVTAGANTINGISTSIADQKSLEAEARKQAIADARDRAEALAAALGVKVGAVITVEEFQSGGAVPLEYGRGGGLAAASVQINQGTLNVNLQVKVTFALES